MTRKRRRSPRSKDRTSKREAGKALSARVLSPEARRKWGYMLLAIAIVCGASLRTVNMLGKRMLHHDEAIAYLASTGHQDAFAEVTQHQSAPFGQWSKASDWKRFVRTENVLCFRTIGKDLATHDVHPPLYFWLLHIWGVVLGVGIWTGPTLNILLNAMGAVLLFRLAKHLLHDHVRAAVVTFLWSVSAAVIQASSLARPYELSALTAILFVTALVCFIYPESTGSTAKLTDYIFLAVATMLGLLTHYHFAILVAGGGLWVLWRAVRTSNKRLLGAWAAMFVGFVLFLLLHPGFLHSFELARAQAQAPGSEPVTQRLARVAATYAGFVLDSASLQGRHHATFEVLIYSILAAGMIFAGARRRHWRKCNSNDTSERLTKCNVVLFLLLWMVVITGGLYLTFMSPKHAMGARYLAMIWPMFAFLPVWITRTLGRFQIPVVVLIVLLVVGGGISDARATYDWAPPFQEPTRVFSGVDWVIMDDVRRGNLPRVLWYCPDDVMIFAASEQHLAEHSEQWASGRDGSGLYVNTVRAEPGNRNWSILRPLAQRYQIKELNGGFWNVGRAYRLLPRT